MRLHCLVLLVSLIVALPTPSRCAPDDENWSAAFAANGTDGPVTASVQFGTSLVVAGDFANVAGVEALRVARWDGTAWQAMGAGFDGEVRVLHVHDGDLYAGGWFQNSGATATGGLARWTGSEWVGVGGGVDASVASMVDFEGDLIVGGDFGSVGSGSVAADGVARWNGTTWSGMNTGFFDFEFGEVLDLAVFQDQLYAGGFFIGASGIGGSDAGHLAVYDGAAWNIVGGGVLGFGDVFNAMVEDLEVFDGALYVAGSFDQAGSGLSYDGLGRWNGSQWTNTSSTFGAQATSSLTVSGNLLYVSDGIGFGRLDTSGSFSIRFFVPGFGGVRHLGTFDSDVVLGGQFGAIEGAGVNNLALFDGNAIRTVGVSLGVNGLVSRAIEWNGGLVVGGTFTSAGGVSGTKNLAFFDGTAWTSPGGGVTNTTSTGILSMEVFEGDLVVGGNFTSIGGVSATRVARWNGTQWSAMGSGSVSTVTALYDWNGTLYAHMDPTPGNGSITRWNGSDWVVVGANTLGGDVARMVEYDGELVVAGQMNSIDGVAVDHVAVYDGSTWAPFAGGVSGGQFTRVFDMIVDGTSLYLAGDFTQAGGTAVGYVARWDGGAWDTLGNGVTGVAQGLARFDGDLVVTGLFAGAGAIAADNIARFDGTDWSPLGSGLDDLGRCLIPFQGQLVVGGAFTRAGDKPASRVAVWSGSPSTSVESMGGGRAILAAAPNPFGSTTTIRYALTRPSRVAVEIHDARGRRIDVVDLGDSPAGSHDFVWNGRDRSGRPVSSGVYFVRVVTQEGDQVAKVSYLR